jgi:hypothetical protein
MHRELPIRLTVLMPPPGVTFAVQRRKDESRVLAHVHLSVLRTGFTR